MEEDYCDDPECPFCILDRIGEQATDKGIFEEPSPELIILLHFRR